MFVRLLFCLFAGHPTHLWPFKIRKYYMIYFRNKGILTNRLERAKDTFMLDSFGELGIANRYN